MLHLGQSTSRSLGWLLGIGAAISLVATGLAATPALATPDGPQSGPGAEDPISQGPVEGHDSPSSEEGMPPPEEPPTGAARGGSGGPGDLEGTLIVLPDESGMLPREERDALEQNSVFRGGLFVATDDGQVVSITGLDLDNPVSGLRLSGTVEVPPQSEDLDGAEVLTAAAESGEPLKVLSAEVTGRPEVGKAGAKHGVDYVWFTKAGAPQPSAADVASAIARTSDYWTGQSEGLMPGMVLSTPKFIDAPDWLACDPWEAWDEAAWAFGKTMEDYVYTGNTHLVVMVDESRGCDGLGLGTVGQSVNSGGLVWERVKGTNYRDWNGTLSHELGHNLSLWHSGATESGCNGRLDLPANANLWPSNTFNCGYDEYGDMYDLMGYETSLPVGGQLVTGWDNLSSLNLTQKVVLGAAQPGSYYRVVTASGGAKQTVTFNSSSSQNGIRGLEVKDPNRMESVYVDYRSGQGSYAGINEYESYYAKASRLIPASSPFNFRPGVRFLKILSGSNQTYSGPQNVDTYSMVLQNPATTLPDYQWYWNYGNDDYWFTPGQTYTAMPGTDGKSGVKIKVISTSETQATVEVTFEEQAAPKSFTQAPTPTITGTPKVGQTLTANAGTWEPTPDSLTYQWLRNGSAIPGASTQTYKAAAADEGKQVSVQVTASRAGYQTTSKTSAAVTITGEKRTAAVTRYSGADRYVTNYILNRETMVAGRPLFVATGAAFPDALSVGPAVAVNNGYLVLTPKNAVPNFTLDLIKARKPSAVYIIGGTGAVSPYAASQIQSASGKTPVRIAGSNRYETSAEIFRYFFGGRTVSSVFVATGADYPDALSAAGAGGALAAPVVLVPGQSAAGRFLPSTAQLLKVKGVNSVVVVGGTSVVTPQVTSNLQQQGFSSIRKAGANRYETNMDLNNYVNTQVGGPSTMKGIWLATGANFPDALSAAAPAGHSDQRLVLSNGKCIPKPVISSWIMAGSSTVTQVGVLGGESALSYDVFKLKECP